MDFGVHGRIVVVTGASRGIGQILASEFSCRGAKVAMFARNERLLKEVAAQFSGEVIVVACDVTDSDELINAFQCVSDRWGGVDSVVANAGVSLETRRIQNVTVQGWRATVDVNLTGAFLTARAAYPHLVSSSGGRLLFVSSVMARIPRHGVGAYAASKAGIEGLARAVSADWAADGICVNAVAPGFISAGMGATLDDAPRLRESVVLRTSFGRLGSATELAHAVLFLSGDGSSFITGQVLPVDGGYGLD